MACRLKWIFWMLGCAATACAQTAIPATPAGRIFAAWMEAFNSGDRAKIDLFVKKYEPLLQHAELTSAQFRGQSGGVHLLAITRSEKYTLAFRLQEKSQPTILYGKLDVTASQAPAVLNFLLHPVPKGAVLEDVKLDAAARSHVIDLITTDLNEAYVYPLVAQKMAASLRQHVSRGDYNAITDGDTFASLLTTHLIEISHDKHLGVFYQPYKFEGDAPQATLDQWNKDRRAMARDCGIRKAEILANNIGYLKLDFFADPMACGRTAASAISFLANTDAVIFDLRDNGGGDPRMVALVSSYLFERPVHLNNFYDRIGNRTTEYWTPRMVPGIRLGQKPAYVLMSGRTFSGAEEFAYDLRNLKRVTLVGETSGGGSHAVNGHPAGDHFIVWVPSARSVSPVTGTDWEGVGVAPDIAVRAEDALETAQRLAAEKIQLNAAREPKMPDADAATDANAAASAKAN